MPMLVRVLHFLACGIFIALTWPHALHAAESAAGRALYQQYCAVCHGAQGKGDGVAGSTLNPKPRDHTDGQYMNQLSQEHLRKVIRAGGPAVGRSPLMPSWNGLLNSQQIDDIIAHIRTLAAPPYAAMPTAQAPMGSVTAGKAVYQKYCAVCHGAQGKGNGVAGSTLNPKPRDHTNGQYMNQLSHPHLAQVIRAGGPAVGRSPLMPSWEGTLNAQQIDDVIVYVRTLAVPPYNP